MTTDPEHEYSHVALRSPFAEQPIGTGVILYEGPLQVNDKNVSASGHGKVTFEFVPEISVSFEIKTTLFDSLSTGEKTIELVGIGLTVDALALQVNRIVSSGEVTVNGILTGKVEVSKLKPDGSPEPIGRVRFHVVNFKDYLGEGLHIRNNQQTVSWAGRVIFKFGDWLVTLDTLPDISKRLDRLKAKGGFAITHLGDLRRQDGDLFKSQDANDVLEFLYWFLSFVNGERCGCLLNSGLRYLSHSVWENWTTHIMKQGAGNVSWFAKYRPIECFSVGEAFYRLWRDKEKREWLCLAISIYTDSNHNTSGVELELTKAQIALELLSWVVLREENTVLSEEGLEKLTAADKIRLTLSWCGIPSPIPEYLTDLLRAFPSQPVIDGPHASTAIRNSVVHPTRRNRDKLHSFSDVAKYDAWQLSMWYVELIILKVLGYSGHYCNRLNRGEMAGKSERVPWA